MAKATKADVQCPFFVTETSQSLYCEGLTFSSSNRIKFNSEDEKISYMEKHCVHFPNECYLARGINAKYPD